jgi:poly(A) polymerase
MKLEFVDSLTLAHPFIKGFDQCFYCLNDEEVRAVAQGEVSEVISRRKKEDVEGKEGMSTVYTTTFYIGLAIEPKPRKSTSTRDSLHEMNTPLQLAPSVLVGWIYLTRPQNSRSW